MIDFDQFKQFNDRYGHKVGDQVLQRVAGTISRTIRKPDTACHYGWEELVVLLPEAGVTASIGVGTLGENEVVEAATLLERADQALYSAKKSGRNQLRVWRKSINDNSSNVFSSVLPNPPG